MRGDDPKADLGRDAHQPTARALNAADGATADSVGSLLYEACKLQRSGVAYFIAAARWYLHDHPDDPETTRALALLTESDALNTECLERIERVEGDATRLPPWVEVDDAIGAVALDLDVVGLATQSIAKFNEAMKVGVELARGAGPKGLRDRMPK